MKPRMGITLIVLIFLGVFTIYSNLPNQADSQINVDSEGEFPNNENVVLGDVIVNPDSGQPQDTERTTGVDITSTGGLDEELRGIVEGFSAITEELQSLEKTSPEPAP